MRRLASPRGLGCGRRRVRVSARLPARAGPRRPLARRDEPEADDRPARRLHERKRPASSVDQVHESGNSTPPKGARPSASAARLFCEKPRDFRLRAKVAGQPAVDIGSNNDEFWFWISQGKDQDGVARVHYCSYQDMSAGKARMPFPFQPDMIVAALGLGEYDADKEYSLKEEANTVSLVEKTVSAQGQPVQRVTVFNRTLQRGRASRRCSPTSCSTTRATRFAGRRSWVCRRSRSARPR